MASFLAKMLNPFSRLKKNIKRSEGTKGNLVGEGLVHGGVYVVPPGGKPFYAHAEVELGDHPPTEDLLNALPQLAPIELPPEPVAVARRADDFPQADVHPIVAAHQFAVVRLAILQLDELPAEWAGAREAGRVEGRADERRVRGVGGASSAGWVRRRRRRG